MREMKVASVYHTIIPIIIIFASTITCDLQSSFLPQIHILIVWLK